MIPDHHLLQLFSRRIQLAMVFIGANLLQLCHHFDSSHMVRDLQAPAYITISTKMMHRSPQIIAAVNEVKVDIVVASSLRIYSTGRDLLFASRLSPRRQGPREVHPRPALLGRNTRSHLIMRPPEPILVLQQRLSTMCLRKTSFMLIQDGLQAPHPFLPRRDRAHP